MTTHAIYSTEVVDGVICVTDLCDQAGGYCRSVTNDAERVIADLAARGYAVGAMPIIYLDTIGNWDELVVRGGRFRGYRSLGMTDDQATAIARAKAHREGAQ